MEIKKQVENAVSKGLRNLKVGEISRIPRREEVNSILVDLGVDVL
jgi:hypothetical protein